VQMVFKVSAWEIAGIRVLRLHEVNLTPCNLNFDCKFRGPLTCTIAPNTRQLRTRYSPPVRLVHLRLGRVGGTIVNHYVLRGALRKGCIIDAQETFNRGADRVMQ